MPKTKEEVQELIDALEEAGFDPESYSGRGMYGKCCVSVKDVSEWEIAWALWFDNLDENDLDIPEPRQDALGRGNVLYWPSYEWPKETEERDAADFSGHEDDL